MILYDSRVHFGALTAFIQKLKVGCGISEIFLPIKKKQATK